MIDPCGTYIIYKNSASKKNWASFPGYTLISHRQAAHTTQLTPNHAWPKYIQAHIFHVSWNSANLGYMSCSSWNSLFYCAIIEYLLAILCPTFVPNQSIGCASIERLISALKGAVLSIVIVKLEDWPTLTSLTWTMDVTSLDPPLKPHCSATQGSSWQGDGQHHWGPKHHCTT